MILKATIRHECLHKDVSNLNLHSRVLSGNYKSTVAKDISGCCITLVHNQKAK